MKIFITGDQGMVGRFLIDDLKNSHHEIVNEAEGIQKYWSRANDSALIRYQEVDISSHVFYQMLEKYQPDLIVNCAGIVGTDICEDWPFSASAINEAAMYEFAKWVQHWNEKRGKNIMRVIHFSTTAIYDPGYYDGEFIAEEYPKEPKTIYGISKYGGELAITNYLDKKYWMIIRPCFLYAYQDKHSVVAKMVQWFLNDHWFQKNRDSLQDFDDRKILLDPHNLKDYMHMSDFTKLMSQIILSEDDSLWGEDFNISLGDPVQFNDIMTIFDEFGFKYLERYRVFPELDYLKNHVVSNSKIKRFFPDWQPIISIREGIEKLLRQAGIIERN